MQARMRGKNVYQRKAAELYRKILKVQTKSFLTKEFEHNGKKYVQQYDAVCINSVTYILTSSFSTVMRNLIANGTFSEDDFVRFRSKQINVFVKLSALLRASKGLLEYFNGDWTQKKITAIIESALTENIENQVFSDEELMQSDVAYRERRKMLRMSREYFSNQDMLTDEQAEREEQERYLDDGIKEERTLRDLVSQIEEMGWNVTLSLKNG